MPAEQVNIALALFCHSLCFALKSFGNPAYLTLFKYLKLWAHCRKDTMTEKVHMQGGLWERWHTLPAVCISLRIIHWLAWGGTQYLWIFFTHVWFNITMSKLRTDLQVRMFMKSMAHPAKLIGMIIKKKSPQNSMRVKKLLELKPGLICT